MYFTCGPGGLAVIILCRIFGDLRRRVRWRDITIYLDFRITTEVERAKKKKEGKNSSDLLEFERIEGKN